MGTDAFSVLAACLRLMGLSDKSAGVKKPRMRVLVGGQLLLDPGNRRIVLSGPDSWPGFRGLVSR